MSFETVAQTVIYQRLANDVALQAKVAGVYDAVPDAAAMPYVTVGEDVHTEWDTFDTLGSSVSITVHTWSQTRGRKQVKELQGLIYNALHRAELTYTAYDIVAVDFENSQTFLDADGRTWHGVQTFHLLIDKRQ